MGTFRYAIFSKTTIKNNVGFIDSNLSYASFYNSTIENTVFKDCDLKNAIFNGCTIYLGKFTDCNLKNAKFYNCNIIFLLEKCDIVYEFDCFWITSTLKKEPDISAD